VKELEKAPAKASATLPSRVNLRETWRVLKATRTTWEIADLVG